MSVIIKGVEMPSKCWPCPCCVDNGLIGRDRECFCSALDSDYEIENLEQRLSSCPLNELPTPHGRLIDADYLIKVLQDTFDNYPDNCNDGKIVENLVVDVCKQFIEHCPTIVEAEVSDERL